MDAYFKKLGTTVLERWKEENFSLPKFSRIACAALDEFPPAKEVALPALMRDFLVNDEQSSQSTSVFGEPELIVYSHAKFYIQMLFWLDGSTSIHQHSFSGAFHVMRGSSIHTAWEFEEKRTVTPHFKLGNVKAKKIELLEKGRTVPIVSGQGFIHSLFHLDAPSVTIVVRTGADPGTDPQFAYLPPHVAFNPFFNDNLAKRRRQLLNVMARCDYPDYLKRVLEMIEVLDFERGFFVLKECMNHLQHIGKWSVATRAFRKRHGKLAAGIVTTLENDRRRNGIVELRSSIGEPEHRIFLALLLNVSTKDELFALIAQRFPGKAPKATVLRWVAEMTEAYETDIEILDACFPELDKVTIEEQEGLLIQAFEHFMSGKPKAPAALGAVSAATLKQWRAIFAASSLNLLLA